MSNPMVIWYAMVGIILLAAVVHLAGYLHTRTRDGRKVARGGHTAVLSQGRQEEMFYVPGDAKCEDEDWGDL